MVKLTINGLGVEVQEGSTVLEAAQFLGFPIPTLCHMEGLPLRRLPAVRGGNRRGRSHQAGFILHLPGGGRAEGPHRLGTGDAGAEDGPGASAGLVPAVQDHPGPCRPVWRPPAALQAGARGLHPVRPVRAHVRGADDGQGHRLPRPRRKAQPRHAVRHQDRRYAGCAAAACTSARPASSAAPIPSPTRPSAAAAPTSSPPASRRNSSTT